MHTDQPKTKSNMAKYRFIPWVEEDENGNDINVAQIQVRHFLFWHVVTEVRDEDPDYVMNRADEIISILENPNT